MIATFYRMMAAIFLAAFFLLPTASAQTFDPNLAHPGPLPDFHRVNKAGADFAKKQSAMPPSSSTNEPSCGFDHLNEERAAQEPIFREELKKHLQEVTPTLSSPGSLAASTVGPLMTVSVVVHIIHNGEPVGQGQNLPEGQIRAQIDVLNEDFCSLNPQYFNTPAGWMGLAGVPNIQFLLATVDPNGNPTNGIDRQNIQVTGNSWNNNNVNSAIKPAINWDPNRYFNIYVLPIPGTTAAGGVVGYSNYPTLSQIGSDQDGVVIDYRWFGAPGYPASGYRSLTHETGHYLGLPHTFNGNSCSTDDGIADTPDIEKSTREYATLNCSNGYPSAPVSCNVQHLYVNYMDYVTENCYTSFTNGQVAVMRAVMDGTSQGFGYGSREELVTSAPNQTVIPSKDAGITRIIAPAAVTCSAGGTLAPEVTLRNFGSSDLTSANIFYRINSGTPVSLAWQGSLFPGQSTNVQLPPFTPVNGEYTLTAYTAQPSGVADQRTSNDTTSVARFTHVAIEPPLVEDFEGENGFPTSTGVFEFNITGDDFAWELSDSASAFGVGGQSVVFNNFEGTATNNPYGSLDAIITRHYDLSEVDGATLKFDVAYAPYDAFLSDTLMVVVATNCSQVFNQLVYKKGGAQLSTAPATTALFTPTATQWRTETVDLSAFDGLSDVTIAVINLSGWGNRLFLDNLKLGRSCNALAWSFETIPNSCNAPQGFCDGSATIEVVNHNGGLNYQWEGWPVAHNIATVYQECPGTATVTVTDAFGCTFTASTQIEQAPSPSLTTATTIVGNYGGSNGSATVNVANAMPPYSYVWSNGFAQNNTNQSSSTATNLPVGNYTVTVTDGLGCTNVAQASVSSVCAGFAVNLGVGNVSCFGGTTGSIYATASNGTSPFNFQWSNGTSGPSLSGIPAGSYTLTANDANGCPATATAQVLQPTAIVLTTSVSSESALGSQDGSASVNAGGGSPGYQYSWSNGGNSAAITGLSPGNYSVTVMDVAGCTATTTVTVNAFTCDDFETVINWTNVTCNGANDGMATVTVNGATDPVSFQWSNGNSGPAAGNLPPGPVAVTVTDAAGCSSQLSTTILQPPVLTATATATNETAAGANNGTATVSGAGGIPLPTGNYSIEWSTGSGSVSISGLQPGTYTVTITDLNGCTATSSATVEPFLCAVTLNLSATPTSCPTVADGSATVENVTGGTGTLGYAWSNGGNTATVTGLTGGFYLVTVTDGSGCTAVGQVTVGSEDNVPPTVLTKNSTVVLGSNGMASITAMQVDNGSFDNCSQVGLMVSPSVFGCDQIGQQQVQLTVSDASGNVSIGSATITVTETTPPIILCPNDLTVNTCGAVSYAPPTAVDNCTDVTLALTAGLESGATFPAGTTVVTWQATDGSGNTSSCSFDITVASDLSLSYTAYDVSCFGENDGFVDLVIAGGVQPFDADWSHGGGPLALEPGQYSVTVSDGAGCTATTTVEIGEPDPLTVELISVTPTSGGQNNGVIQVSIQGGTGPMNLVWKRDGVTVPNFNPSAAAPGSYLLEVTDDNGCTATLGPILVDNLDNTDFLADERLVTLFPNPTRSSLYVLMKNAHISKLEMTVFDAVGRQVQAAASFNSNSYSLDTQLFAPGIYWLKMTDGNWVVWKKFVRE